MAMAGVKVRGIKLELEYSIEYLLLTIIQPSSPSHLLTAPASPTSSLYLEYAKRINSQIVHPVQTVIDKPNELDSALCRPLDMSVYEAHTSPRPCPTV